MRKNLPYLPGASAILITLFIFLSWTYQPYFYIQFNNDREYIYRGPEAEDKVLVLARTKDEDTSWVTEELPDWQNAIYQMDEQPGPLRPPIRKGREAMAYLTFIIDHYHILPSTMVFLHPHRRGYPVAWHTDAPEHDNVQSIQSLRIDYVQANGYANMRCIHDPGCPAEIQPFREEEDRTAEHAMVDAWQFMFGGNVSAVPEVIAEPCCSQFAVSKAQVYARSLDDYLRYRQWLIETDLIDAVSGRVMEYLWHVIFGKDPVYCPELRTCWCDQFGRC